MLPTRACYFIGLNAVRFMSIVALLLVFSSSIFVMVNDVRAVNSFMAANPSNDDMTDCDYIENSTVPNQAAGVFWAVLNRILIILEVVVLLLAELSPPVVANFFDRFFPVLGPNFGLGALGVFECLIGATILSHHVDDWTLVSAFFLFSVGCVNILLGLIFRERAKGYRSIPAFRAERKATLPQYAVDNRPAFGAPAAGQVASYFSPPPMPRSGSRASSYNDEKDSGSAYGGYGVSEKSAHYESDYRAIAAAQASRRDLTGYGFGRQGEKQAALRGFLISKPIETLPKYSPGQGHQRRPSSVASSDRAHSPVLADTGAFERSRSPSPVRPVPTFHSSPIAL